MALGLDSSLVFRPNPGPGERAAISEGSPDTRSLNSAAFARALDGAGAAGHTASTAPTTRHVAPTRTPLSGSQAADALEAAWQGARGQPPSPRTLSILVGQWAHETGHGAAMLNYNFGGLKGAGPSGASTLYRTHEGSGTNQIQTQDRFRAYDSAEQGASDYLSLLQRRYPAALQAADRGDPVAFAQALKSHGYFTGDEGAYAKSVAALAQRALESGFDALGSPDAAPSLSTAASDPTLALLGHAPSSGGEPAAGAYARSMADEVGRVELLMSALRIGQLGEKAG